MKDLMGACLCFLSGLILLLNTASAAERPFYQGKTITFFINFSAGGPTDIEGRIVARHLARHIPGNPTIVVQNMSGGGGVAGINFLGEVAKPDALTLGYFTGPFNHQMMKSTTLRVDLQCFLKETLGYSPLWVAHRQGFFDQPGLDVLLVLVSGGAASIHRAGPTKYVAHSYLDQKCRSEVESWSSEGVRL